MLILSHPTGNQNSRNALKGLSDAGLLKAFLTAITFDSNSSIGSLLPLSVRRELARREFSGFIAAEGVSSVAQLREVARLISQKLGINALIEREKGWASIESIYHSVDRAVAKKIRRDDGSITAIYGYEDGALESFKAAKAKGIERIYELPIGYWRTHRRLCEEEALFKPDWAHTWQASLDSEQKLRRKDEELALASQIIVPSQFVAESLKEYPDELAPIKVVPYGCPSPINENERNWYSGGTLKVLYVGGLSQRKGLSYIVDALEPLGEKVELTIVGTGGDTPLTNNHKYRMIGSLPFDQVLKEMREHDIFIFPSLFEGFGMVITEALSQGMPVIISPNTGPADMVTDGVEGWVVPIRDSEAITERLEQCIQTPELVKQMGLAALALAGKHSWQRYREELIDAIELNESEASI